MKSSNIKSASNSSGTSKSKKNFKDREKKKSAIGTEKNDQSTSEKGSPSKDTNLRKYAGIGPDSISIYSEQSVFEHLSEDVTCGFAEDLSYKLRYVIHDALIKARLSGRNYISSADIESTFNDLTIDHVYGATSTPNWIALAEQGLYYLDDPIINLVELAEKESTYAQPGDVTMTRKWISEKKDISKPLRDYFETICHSIVSKDSNVREFALHDIAQNNLIGQIVEWFYRFGYFLLSKDITYDCLTLSALSLIEALEKNPTAPLIVTEKQLILLARLLLQRLLRSVTTTEVLKPMCKVLGILCNRSPILELVIMKIQQKLPEVKPNFLLPIISIINTLGVCAVQEIFLPNIENFIYFLENNYDSELTFGILQSYWLLCKANQNTKEIDEQFFDSFGGAISTMWRPHFNVDNSGENQEINWLKVRLLLIKTRKHFSYVGIQKIYDRSDVFPDISCDTENCDDKQLVDTTLSPVKFNSKNGMVTIGKRTLLISVLNQNGCKSNVKCNGHNLMFYNL